MTHPHTLAMQGRADALLCPLADAGWQASIDFGTALWDTSSPETVTTGRAMNPFSTLQIPEAQRYCIRQARVPTCFLPDGARTTLDRDGATLVDLLVDNDKIAAIEPAGGTAFTGLPGIDLGSRHVWPTLIDMHAHLDKGHIVTRTENPDGSFAGALQSTAEDRTRRWTAEDVKRRMEFGLRCAYVHGVAAIRTHLDSLEPDQAQRSWTVFREMRAEWADRVLLQAVALVPIDAFRTPYGRELADLVAASGGILGGVTRAVGGVHGRLLDDIDALLDTILRLASERGLDVDLHVDESGDPAATALAHVAAAVLRNRFKGRVACGHCCSLAVQPQEQICRTLDLCAEAGIAVVTLPTVNLYLQDRCGGRTPRWRGSSPRSMKCVSAAYRSRSQATIAATRSTPMAIMTWSIPFVRPFGFCIWTIRSPMRLRW